jgi:hypothetical protein
MKTGTNKKEYGLPFNADMVRAMIEGRKTMTRRIPAFMNCTVDGKRVNKEFWTQLDIKNGTLIKDLYKDEISLLVINIKTKQFHSVRPIWKEGDCFWVKEKFVYYPMAGDCGLAGPIYEADNANMDNILKIYEKKWCPPMFMPRCASRITAEMTSVKFEFLQDISELDSLNEGTPLKYFNKIHGTLVASNGTTTGEFIDGTAVNAFSKLWDSIYGKTEFAWKENYPLIAVSFKIQEVQQKITE